MLNVGIDVPICLVCGSIRVNLQRQEFRESNESSLQCMQPSRRWPHLTSGGARSSLVPYFMTTSCAFLKYKYPPRPTFEQELTHFTFICTAGKNLEVEYAVNQQWQGNSKSETLQIISQLSKLKNDLYSISFLEYT